MTSYVVGRGPLFAGGLLWDQRTLSVSEGPKPGTVPWVPDTCLVASCDTASIGCRNSLAVANNAATVVQTVMEPQLKASQKMIKRKAFVHWYGGEEDILEAELNVRDLLDEYVYELY
jgi:hypothetical protein